MEISLEALRLYYNGQRDRWRQSELQQQQQTSLLQTTAATISRSSATAVSSFLQTTTTTTTTTAAVAASSSSSSSQYRYAVTTSYSSPATTTLVTRDNLVALFAQAASTVSSSVLEHLSSASTTLLPANTSSRLLTGNEGKTDLPRIITPVSMIFNVHELGNVVSGGAGGEVARNGTGWSEVNGSVVAGNGTAVNGHGGINYWAFVPILLIVAGLVGNLLVCLAIFTERRLQTPTNYFLLSLAVADLLVSILVMPLGIVAEIFGYWPMHLHICILYSFSDIMCCTSSILHMCLISIDRFLGIKFPLKRRNSSKYTVLKKLAAVWIVSFGISSPVIALSIIDPRTVIPAPDQCGMTNKDLMVWGSLFAFFLPLAIMCVMMVLTARELKKQAKWSQGKRCEAGAGAQIKQRNRTAIRRHPAGVPLINNARYRTNSTISFGRPRASNGNLHTSPGHLKSLEESSSESPDVADDQASSPTRAPKNGMTPIGLLNRNREKKNAARQIDSEKKATKVLTIIFVLFSVFWVPFFAMTFVTAAFVLPDPPTWVIQFFLWLGWASSTVNPVIYTIVNPNFRQAFIRLLSMGKLGERCRRQVQVSVQTCREWSSQTTTTLRRQSANPCNPSPQLTMWSSSFLSALELNNETPV